VRTSALTWTPVDSHKRAKGHHDKDKDPNAAGGANGRGMGADWHRFSALTQVGLSLTVSDWCQIGVRYGPPYRVS
jgi:hypothetical protein